MSSALSRPVVGVSLILAAAFIAGASATPATAAEKDACTALAESLQQTKPDTQLQRNIALFSAVSKDCLPIAQRMFAAGASVEASNRFGTTALGQAARTGNLTMVDFLLQHGAAINARNVGGATPLYIAADSDRTAVVHRLLAKGADPNLARSNGLTPLTAAAYNGSDKIVADLLANHANPNAPDNTEKTAILYAAAKGFTPVVQLLLKAGVDAKAQYGNHLTALMWAAGYADGAGIDDAQSVAKLLLKYGALLDAADNRGRTALMIAAETGHLEMVDLLLKRGANRNLRDNAGKSAADLASSAAVKQRLLTH
jgi:ankyrin repeat protein